MKQMLDCLIIGAGQSGLCAAKKLNELGISYLVLERGSVGEAWHNRMSDMQLFTSREFCSLPGLAFPGVQSEYPTANEVCDYLQEYRNKFNISVNENSEVISVVYQSGYYTTKTADGVEINSKSLINATGSNQISIVPSLANELSESVRQIASSEIAGVQMPENCKVLVVGDGASGRQLAASLSKTNNVVIATGSKRGLPPNRILGKDLFWWLSHLGIVYADTHSFVAKILKRKNPVPCREFNNRRLKMLGVRVVGRLVSFDDNTAFFENGNATDVDAVIWAVGYKDDTSWLEIAHAKSQDEFLHVYGKAPNPGLFLVGARWLSCRASELIMGAERDAALVTSAVADYLKHEWSEN